MENQAAQHQPSPSEIVTISGNSAAMILLSRAAGAAARNRRGVPALQKRLRDFDTFSRVTTRGNGRV